MTRVFEVVTPEQVAIRYELAGFGARALAALIDLAARLVVLLLLGVIVLLATGGAQESTSSVFIGVALLVNFLVTWGYYIFFETLWHGETPGKRLLGLRVIKDGGHPVDFRAVAVRNLVRAVDEIPLVYAVGFVAVLFDPQYRRLGDMAAGTLVVCQRSEEEELSGFTYGETVTYRLIDAAVISRLARLTRDEFRLIQFYLERRHRLILQMRAEFARRIALPLMGKVEYALPEYGLDYERWLGEVDLAYRSHALGTAIAATPAVALAPQPAIDFSPPPSEEADPDERKW